MKQIEKYIIAKNLYCPTNVIYFSLLIALFDYNIWSNQFLITAKNVNKIRDYYFLFYSNQRILLLKWFNNCLNLIIWLFKYQYRQLNIIKAASIKFFKKKKK